MGAAWPRTTKTRKSSVYGWELANYFIAEYHFSGGDFVSIADRNLDLAVKYYSRTLAIIKTYNSYPPLKYSMWEENHNIEMTAYYMLPLVYWFFVNYCEAPIQ